MAIAVQSPFNTSPAYSGTFIPQIWSGKLNVKFYATTVFGEISNTTYEGDIKNVGDTVIINNIPSVAISNYTVGQTLTYQVPTPNKIQLNISQAKYFGVNVSDVLDYQAQPQLMDMFTSDAAKQMAIAIDTDVLLSNFQGANSFNRGAAAGLKAGVYNLGTDTAPLVLTTSNVVTMVTNMASVLDEQNVPDTDRFLVITPYVRNILMSSPLAQAYVTGDPQSILRNGKIGMIDRFTIYVSNLLPTAAAGFNYLGSAAANGISTISGTIVTAGTGYVTGDIVSLAGGTDGLVRVTASAGAVTAVTLVNPGSGYTVTTPVNTTAVTGVGTGLQLNVTAVAPTLKRTAIMFGHKTAITFASQITKVESLQNPNDFGSLVRGLNVYGYQVVKPEALGLAQIQ